MAKFKIAPNPTFKADVDIPRVGGETIKVPFVFKYRNREELADLYDAWRARAQEMQASLADGEHGLAEYTAAQVHLQVDQIQDLVVGWDFEDEVSPESIHALVQTCSGAPDAVLDAYSKAFNQARRGN